MSLKTLAMIAGLAVGTLAFGSRANAQVYPSGGYVYTPGVVTTSYYTPAPTWPYSTPYVSAYYTAPYYGGYISTPYYAGYYTPYYSGYPYYGTGVYVGYGPRRWWWR
jgi:hypothetical protein